MQAYEFVLPYLKTDAVFEHTLAQRFGGFTSWRAKGAWAGPSGLEVEEVLVYRVAVDDTDRWFLFHFALAHARNQGEKALYFGPPDSPTVYQTGN